MVFCRFIWECRWALPLVEIWSNRFLSRLVKWDRLLIPSAESVPSGKIHFCSRLLRLSVFLWCKDSPQVVMLLWEWLGRIKSRATGLNASVSFFSTSRRCSRKRSANLLPVLRIKIFFHIACRLCNRWHLGDECKVVSDFSGSIGSQDLNCVWNKGTGLASCSWLVSYLNFCRVWMNLMVVE